MTSVFKWMTYSSSKADRFCKGEKSYYTFEKQLSALSAYFSMFEAKLKCIKNNFPGFICIEFTISEMYQV